MHGELTFCLPLCVFCESMMVNKYSTCYRGDEGVACNFVAPAVGPMELFCWHLLSQQSPQHCDLDVNLRERHFTQLLKRSM